MKTSKCCGEKITEPTYSVTGQIQYICSKCLKFCDVVEEELQESFRILPVYQTFSEERKTNALNLLQKWVNEEFIKIKPQENLKKELYRIVDSFLVEAKDLKGNDRSLKRLNADRHLAVENLTKIIFQEIQNAEQKAEQRGAEKERKIIKKNIGMLRQYLNERSNGNLITNKELEDFLIH